MRCSDLRTEKFVDLKHYAMHNKIYKQKICLNKSILHASVSSAANNLKNFLHLFIWGKGLRQICVSSPFLQPDQSFVSWELLLLDPSLFWIIGEGEVSVSKRFTLQPQVQGLQFQQQQHIYLQFEPAGWFYLYVTDYLDLCCKAPSGESHGLPCLPEDSSLSSCFFQLLAVSPHLATAALSFLTRWSLPVLDWDPLTGFCK